MQVDERRRSFACWRCGGDLQLEVCARLMFATAQVMSRPCQQSVRSALACVGRRSLILCAVGHVCLAVCAHLDECRVPSPAASIELSPAHLGGYFGSAGRLGGGEAWRFQVGDALCAPRLAPQRQFAAYLERACGIAKRRPCAVSGPWRPHLCVCCWT